MAKTLLEVLTEENIDLVKGGGSKLKGHCPFHKGDNDPSFVVYPDGGYYCYGCHAWGDVVKFLVDFKGLSSREALDIVGEDYKQPRAEKAQVIKVQNTIETYNFLSVITEQYHKYLLGLQGAIDYLHSRGLIDTTIQKYKVGYTDGHVLNLPFASERKLATEVNLLTKNGYETMAHRIVVPDIISDDMVDFIMGRTIINDKVKYLGLRMPKPLVGFHEVRKSPIIFLVEGQFDWLMLRQWGYPAICASGSALKDYLKLPLYDKTMIVIPDIDDGVGIPEATKTANSFGDKGFMFDISPLRKGNAKLDVNSLGQEPDGALKFKQLLIESMPWIIPTLMGTQSRVWFPALADSIPSASI